MDRPAPAPPQQRDIVYCHACENEWYRDEHGMTPCPECGEDFTEVIDAQNDPRHVPDPDEEDIDHFELRNNEAGAPHHFHGTFSRNINFIVGGGGGGMPQGQQGGAGGGGLFGILGGALQTVLAGAQNGVQQARAQQLQQQQLQQQQQGQQVPHGEDAQAHPGSAYNEGPGQQPGEQPGQQPGQQPGMFVRHADGPGYSYTITSNFNLQPRDANGPQPAQNHPDDINRLMASMLANIGTQPHGGPGNFRFGPPGFGLDEDDHLGAGPPGPFANIFRMLGMPMGGVHGDAVYSQEALDRIITQLMEQNASGNAPGPASDQAISSLPKKQISESDLDEQGKADCTICMDDVSIGAEVTVLPCSHWFHFDCIKAWLTEHDTCPHCRQGITPRDQAQPAGHARSPSQPPLNNTQSSEYQEQMPGGFPFSQPDANAPAGSQQNPISIPGSPQQERRTGSSGMFSRMRETFGGGGGGGGGPPDQGRPR